MSLPRIRTAAAVIATAGVLLALTACAPPVHHVPTPGSFSTTKPTKITPIPTPVKPALATKPKSDYSFGCADLIGGRTLPTLFSVSVTSLLTSKLDRINKSIGIPGDYYVEVLGGLDCSWYDNQPISSSTSHTMTLTLLPVDSSVWTKFVQSAGEGVSGNTFTECSNDEGINSCQYDGYVNGTWFELTTSNMKPNASAFTTLPAAVQTVVNAINTRLSAGPASETNGPQKGIRPLPSEPVELIPLAEVKADLGLPASSTMTLNCNGSSDGPWTIGAEAETELTGGSGCNFDTPDGGTYGGFDVLSGGQWAAFDALANTPGETSFPLLNQPAGDGLDMWTDDSADIVADLIVQGNWVSFYRYPADSSETAATQAPKTSLNSLALSAIGTVGS